MTATPDRSGNAARPVSVRARHTGSGQWISPRHARHGCGAARHPFSCLKYRAVALPGIPSAGDIPPVIAPLVAQYRHIR
ncbi:hypothetical protein ZG85_003690 [Salmonella enterica subsp. enterica serovar Java]|nr:hypothetical protein [Salmonella enterica subsp. enterica serovar Java]